MRSVKRLLLASIGVTTALLVILVVALMAATVVWVGTGADPTDAFREPSLANSSLSADLVWDDATSNALLGPVESEQLADAWADAFALLERRSSGETVNFERRFDVRIADGFAADGAWAPFEVLEHDISLELVSTNRQVAALQVKVTVDRRSEGAPLIMIETYEAVLANRTNGWTIITFNRVEALMES